MFKAFGMGVLGVLTWLWVVPNSECVGGGLSAINSSACDIPMGAWVFGVVLFILTIIMLSREKNGK